MLKLIVALVATLLVSPTLAKNTTIVDDDPKPACVNVAAIESTKPEGMKLKIDIKGDDLKHFKLVAARHAVDLGDKIDEVRVYGSDTPQSTLFITFGGGCAIGIGQIEDKVLGEFKDPESGSI